MPPPVAHEPFALRVDVGPGGADSGALVDWLRADGGAFFAVSEHGAEGPDDNPHVHVLLFSGKRPDALRKAFTRAFPALRGNGSYSLETVRDLEKYERYCCKGPCAEEGPAVLASHGVQYTEEWITDRHAEYWEINEQLQAAKRARVIPVFDSVFEQAVEAQIAWNDERRLAKLFIQELAARDKPINTYSVRSQINLLMVKLCPGDEAIDRLAERLC